MRQLRRLLLTLCASLLVSLPLVAVAGPNTAITGGTVTTIPIATGVTTDTTSAVVDVPNGRKTFFGQVECTAGACTQTQAIYGTNYPTAVKGVLICTITLSATSTDYDACPVVTAAFPRYYVITTSTAGTNATGAIYVSY